MDIRVVGKISPKINVRGRIRGHVPDAECPECGRRNLSESQDRCFDCESPPCETFIAEAQVE